MSNDKYLITLFASSTNEGKDLVSKLNNEAFRTFVEEQLASRRDLCIKSEIHVIYPSDIEHNTIHFQLYQKKSNIVIFDASIEEYDNGLLGDNYKCVPHAPYMNSNVFIVSRTVLPLNFIPHTTNVLPFGENFYIKKDGKITPINSYNNEVIVEFIKEKITLEIQNVAQGILYKKGIKSSVKKNPQLYLSNGEKIAFISYRSYYYNNHKCGNTNIRELKQYILNYHKEKNPNEKWKVIFYPPGGLSQDCPTEYLRWALFTYVENVFIHVDEVWIFDTNNIDEKSYWDSWFTQGEFISLMKIQQDLPEHMPNVFLFDPHTKTSKKLSELPVIHTIERRELSLLSANSDILWGDYAALRNVILFLSQWKSYSYIKKSLWRFGGKSLSFITNLLGKEIPLDFNAMSKEYAYQPEFLTNRIFSCSQCIKTGHNIESFKSREFIHQFIHIGDKNNQVPGYFTLTQERFIEAIKNGYVKCPICHKKIYIKRNPSQDFYLWKKWTIRTNSEHNEWYIEKILAYSVVE